MASMNVLCFKVFIYSFCSESLEFQDFQTPEEISLGKLKTFWGNTSFKPPNPGAYNCEKKGRPGGWSIYGSQMPLQNGC